LGVSTFLRQMKKPYEDKESFSPKIWANEAHKMLDANLGPNWKEEYVVWDCAWGTGNLTRDYRFKELYCSTLIEDELQLGGKYNSEAVKFQYDFLSEIGIEGLPKAAEGLKKAFTEGKKVLFLVNPPYGTANNAGTKEGDHKGDIAKTGIHAEMKECGRAKGQLYAQFIYKMVQLGGTVAMFSKPLFLTGCSFKKFREFWFAKYRMADGMLFQASEFADVSSQWGVMFSLWQAGQDERVEWPISLRRSSDDLARPVESFGEKVLYNLDGKEPCSKWVREEIKGLKAFDAPQMASALNVKQVGRGLSASGSIGCLVSGSNSVYKNGTGTFILSSCATVGPNAGSFSVIPVNFRKCCALFTARRTITGKHANWINDKDEYQAPNEKHPEYEQWNTDAIVYSLFNTASNQSSLRDVEYKGKLWQIKNEWFWLPRQKILALADNQGNDEVYQDAKTYKDRYVYGILGDLSLSPKAQVVLDKATELVEKTFEYREMANDEHPEWCINTWDAGYYQVKLLLKAYMRDELKAFSMLYKELSDELREGVYEFGFLRR